MLRSIHFFFPTTSTTKVSAHSILLNVINSVHSQLLTEVILHSQLLTEVILQSVHTTVVIWKHITILVFSKLVQGWHHPQIALRLYTRLCFGPTEQNSCLIFSACSRAAKNSVCNIHVVDSVAHWKKHDITKIIYTSNCSSCSNYWYAMQLSLYILYFTFVCFIWTWFISPVTQKLQLPIFYNF
jgi:hypothetical protein